MASMRVLPAVRRRLSVDRTVRAGSAGDTVVGVAGGKNKKNHRVDFSCHMTIMLAACSNDSELKSDGNAPYELTDREKYLLQSLDLENNSQITSSTHLRKQFL